MDQSFKAVIREAPQLALGVAREGNLFWLGDWGAKSKILPWRIGTEQKGMLFYVDKTICKATKYLLIY